MEKNGSSRKLKIAIVLDWFLPSKGGESYLVWLADELSRRGHEVHVFAIEAEKDPAASYQVHLIPVLRWPRSLRMLSFLLNSARLIKKDDFDIIHGVGWTLGHECLQSPRRCGAGLPQAGVSFHQQQVLLPLETGEAVSVAETPSHPVDPEATVPQPQGQKNHCHIPNDQEGYLLNSMGILQKRSLLFSTPWISTDSIRGIAISTGRKNVRPSVFPLTPSSSFLSGNNYRLKGLEPLMAAMGLLRKRFPTQPFRLLVAGRGQVVRYRRKARRLGVSDLVLFLGSVRDIEQYYAASDIYVHPTFYDSCSLTVLEALASGLPVVTTRSNGAADAVVSEEGGRVIEDPANVEDLAESIAHYFDEGRRTRARTVARQWMEQVPPSYNMEQTLRVYYEVVGEAKRERAATAGMR